MTREAVAIFEAETRELLGVVSVPVAARYANGAPAVELTLPEGAWFLETLSGFLYRAEIHTGAPPAAAVCLGRTR